MRIAYDNKLDGATLSTNYPSTNYPLENIVDKRLSRIYQSTSGVNLAIKAQGAPSIAASCIMIANHDIRSAATIKIQGNATDVWTAPSFERTLTHSNGIITDFWTETTYAYWRLLIDDSTNPEIKIGAVFLGNYIVLPNRLIGNRVRDYDTSTYRLSRSNQVYGTQGHRYRSITAAFPGQLVDDTVRDALRVVWANVGSITPFFLTSFSDRPDIEAPMYAIFDQDNMNWAETADSSTNWEFDVTFREVA